MKNIIGIRLNKNLRYKDATVSEAEPVRRGLKTQNDLMDEMVAEGVCSDKETLQRILDAFHKKAASYALGGYEVHTELVKLSVQVHGLVYDGQWNKSVNRVDVKVESGATIKSELQSSKVEIESKNSGDQSVENQYSDYDMCHEGLFVENETPACGIVFRQWLCNSI